MKVALIGRSSLYTVSGGDTTQMVKTARALEALGVQADVILSKDPVDYHRYDLLHFFNILRPADHLAHIRKAGRPYVVSTIYLDYTAFDRLGRSQPYRWLFKALGRNGSEYVKNLYRYGRKQDSMVSARYLLGHKRAMMEILSGAALLLPNSHSEYRRLHADTGFSGDYAVVPNGIDKEIFREQPGIERKEKVLCVAQVYGMKNQHRLIEACQHLDLPLEIIGKAPPNHTAYYDFCRKIAGNRVSFFDFMTQEELKTHYASARVHALPSWFETTGLTSLEAGAMGCHLVVGKGGDTGEYFGDLASYCNAPDTGSIIKALEEAMNREDSRLLKEKILSEYTWEKAAEKTRNAYEKALNG